MKITISDPLIQFCLAAEKEAGFIYLSRRALAGITSTHKDRAVTCIALVGEPYSFHLVHGTLEQTRRIIDNHIVVELQEDA